MTQRHDCTNPAGHNYQTSGSVATCQNTGCGKVQIYNPLTKTWEADK